MARTKIALIGGGNIGGVLAEQAAYLLVAPVDLGDTFLAAAAHDLGHGDEVNFGPVQCVEHFVQPVGLDDGGDVFHDSSLISRRWCRRFLRGRTGPCPRGSTASR